MGAGQGGGGGQRSSYLCLEYSRKFHRDVLFELDLERQEKGIEREGIPGRDAKRKKKNFQVHFEIRKNPNFIKGLGWGWGACVEP